LIQFTNTYSLSYVSVPETFLPICRAVSEAVLFPQALLFPMHIVFCTGELMKIDDSSPLGQVALKLTLDDNPQLRTLTDRIRKVTSSEIG
jgi:hypothetical protein